MPQSRKNKMFSRILKPKQIVPTQEHGDYVRLILSMADQRWHSIESWVYVPPLELGVFYACFALKVTLFQLLSPDPKRLALMVFWPLECLADMEVQLICKRELMERLETDPAQDPWARLATGWISPSDPCWCMYYRRISQLRSAQIMPKPWERWYSLVGVWPTKILGNLLYIKRSLESMHHSGSYRVMWLFTLNF